MLQGEYLMYVPERFRIEILIPCKNVLVGMALRSKLSGHVEVLDDISV